MRYLLALILLGLFLGGSPAMVFAQTDSNDDLPIDPPTAEELRLIFRPLILAALPNPLLSQDMNWGHQEMVTNGIRWEKKGILLKPHKMEALKNDGTWRKIEMTAVDPDKNLKLLIANVKQPENGKITFDAVMSLNTDFKFEQQVWKAGVRLYSGETRGRVIPILHMKCESTSRVEKNGTGFPDLVFRMRIVEAKLNYEGFRVEHTLGVGGDAAKILGDTAHDVVKIVKPSLERRMLEKANQTIVKAGDSKEIRISIGKLLEGK